MARRLHTAYGTANDLRAEVEKLTATGYTQSRSWQDRHSTEFYFGPDVRADTMGSRERFVLIWEAEE
jgi:hypothetical protein